MEIVDILKCYGVSTPWHCFLNSLSGLSQDPELCTGDYTPPLSADGAAGYERWAL